MTENFIQLKKDNILRIGIRDANGVDTGEHFEFDMEDIEFPLKLQEMQLKHKRNLQNARNQFLILEKKEDKKGKFLLSWKEEQEQKIVKEFYEKEMETFDIILGENGTKKFLNGRKPYYSMYEDINEMLDQISPLFENATENIVNKIKSKYNTEETDVLK